MEANLAAQRLDSDELVLKPVVEKKKNVEILSFLRAIAALSVCLYHYTGAVLPKLRIESVREIFQNGWLGVEVFFVISGFIIPYSLLGKNYEVSNFFSYMKKRIIRINPPAYMAMFLVLLQGYIIDYLIAHKVVYTADVSWMQIVNNLFFTVPFSDSKWVVGIFWTLAIEFQFYIFMGLLFKVLFEKFDVFLFTSVFVAMGLMQYLPFQSNEHFFRFSSLFALGGVAMLFYVKRISALTYAFLVLLFVVIAYFELSVYMAGAGLFTTIFINFISFRNKIFDFLGKISYSFYLVHALIGTTCEYFLIKFINPDVVANKIIMLLICIMAAIAGSYVFYLIVEKKFLSLTNSMLNKNK